ncbi:hypothetical protein AAH991_30530 [Microbispora sp. ZYX-F-249]|uniref:Tetratricopeptide repeat protein n=1 Tax=Microbispora maris TaxID=3144104 RepID=A0ABV0AW36_9ACTN
MRRRPIRWQVIAAVPAVAALSAAVFVVARAVRPEAEVSLADLAAVAIAAGATVAAVVAWAGGSRLRASGPTGPGAAPVVQDQLYRDTHGRLPRVRDLDDPVALGVHPAPRPTSGAPSFVRRDLSGELEQAIAEAPFVLVVGDSTAGKTRAAYEAVRAVLPEHILVYPQTRESFPAAVTAARRVRRAVLWLDDIERYASAAGFTAQTFRELATADDRAVRVVGTIRARERAVFGVRGEDLLSPASRRRNRTVREVLALAREVELDRRWSEAELTRAAASEDDRVTTAGQHAGRFGVAEYLAAGPQLYRDWRDALACAGTPDDTRAGGPRGGALVAAAVDARRAGFHAPLPAELLRRLHEGYLSELGGPAVRPEPWERALRWATQPLHGTSSLIMPGDMPDTYLAFDYLADTLAKSGRQAPVPTFTWEALIDHGGPRDCVDIATQARECARDDIAESAFRKAWAAGNLEGARGLASVLGITGRPSEAIALLAEATTRAGIVAPAEEQALLALRVELAWWTHESGEAAKAVPLARALVAECRTALGQTAETTLGAQIVLARCLGFAGEAEEACRLAHAAAKSAATALGPLNDCAVSARFEQTLQEAWRDGTRAVSLWERAIDEELAISGAGSVVLIDYYRALAFHLADEGRFQEARAQAGRAVRLAERLGRTNIRRVYSRLALARWTALSGDRDEGLRMTGRLLDDCRRIHGVDHELTWDVREGLADLLYALDEYAEARRHWEELRADLPAGHTLALYCRGGVAKCRMKEGDVERGDGELAAVVAEFTRINGPRDRNTTRWRDDLTRLRAETSAPS